MLMIKPVGLTTLVLILSSTTLGGCAADRSRTGYVPPEALIGPSGQVSDAIVAFASKVQSETLAGYRREARTDMMRGAIRDFFEGDNTTEEAFNALVPGPKDLLCKPRYGYLRIAAPIQNTNAKASSVKDLLKPHQTM